MEKSQIKRRRWVVRNEKVFNEFYNQLMQYNSNIEGLTIFKKVIQKRRESFHAKDDASAKVADVGGQVKLRRAAGKCTLCWLVFDFHFTL